MPQFAGAKFGEMSWTYHLDPLLSEHPEPLELALVRAFKRLAELYPDQSQSAVYTDEWDLGEELGSLKPVPLKVRKGLLAGERRAYRMALAKALKSLSTELFITTDPASIWPELGVSSVLLLSNGVEWQSKKPLLKSLLGKKDHPGWLAADRVVVQSDASRETLIQTFPQLERRVSVIPPILQEPLAPLEWAEQASIKVRYSGGRDYFLYAGPIREEAQLVELLKAYSLVKKWLLTSMPIIIAGPSTGWTPRFEQLLSTYKYRADVFLELDPEPEVFRQLVASAYLLVAPSPGLYAFYPVEWAWTAGIPVVLGKDPDTAEVAGQAVAMVPKGDIDQLAHTIMLLYKDENLRGKLVEKGQEHASIHHRDATLRAYASLFGQVSGGTSLISQP
ncbi:glycosyltransferase [Flavihumibacter rivuli]|uniref:glycosyltransferase n=1 Tax=Flavihumibacter rivuli TaxID=2838156 RepID=UPI001BDF279F|nr:glycosyltransferase [Flavihumibacter rivuli]ULQ56090.1 glycosyltransferase [Flavihumibacter rivuli]